MSELSSDSKDSVEPEKKVSKDSDEVTKPEESEIPVVSLPKMPISSKSKKLPPDHPKVKLLAGVLLILVCASVGFLGGWAGSSQHVDNSTTIEKQKVILENQGQLISSIANTVGQSVVVIDSTQSSAGSSLDNLFGFSGQGQSESAGTGIILNSSGLIITNRHVVPAGTTSVSVTLANGTTYNDVQVVGRTSTDDSLDIAFLQIPNTDGQTLVPAQLGNSSKMQVGDSVVAIGNALGQYQNTVTSGIISGYGRSVQASDSTGTSTENLVDLFQTDAAINEGNSGGPLVNVDAQVIGINTAIASNAQNIGFAIPINDVTGLIRSVEKTGKLQQPYLGIIYIPITADIAKQYNLSQSSGAYIPPASVVGGTPIVSGGPAAQAGLKAGDIITDINGIKVNQQNDLTSILDQQTAGSKVTLTIVRGTKVLKVNVVLGTAPTG